MNNRRLIYTAIAVIIVAVLTATAVLVYAFNAKLKPFAIGKNSNNQTEHGDSSPKDPIAGYDQIVNTSDKSPVTPSTQQTQNGKSLHIPILMYHHIGTAPATADATHRGLTVSPTEFEAQVKWLHDNGYESVTIDDLYQNIENEVYKWPKKPIIFTFDDGYTDVFENAVPILKKYGYIGTFAIITSNPGQTQGDNYYATWEQIQIAKNDGMEIICHTQNHFDGSSAKFTPEYIYENLSGCQSDLKNYLGEAPPFLVYPYGHFTPTYVSQALKAGFVMAFTVHEGTYVNTDDLMHIPRVRVNPNETMEKFIEKLSK